jgi:hypothetical protein
VADNKGGWGTFWAAISALTAVVGILIAINQGGATPDRGIPGVAVSPSVAGTSQPAPSDTAVSVGYGTIRLTVDDLAHVYSTSCVCSDVVAELPNGSSVRIYCTAQGDVVRNNGLASSLWNRTEYGFVPDVNVETGTSAPVAPAC